MQKAGELLSFPSVSSCQWWDRQLWPGKRPLPILETKVLISGKKSSMGCGWPVVSGSFETLEKGLENHENSPFKIVLFGNNMWGHVRIRMKKG